VIVASVAGIVRKEGEAEPEVAAEEPPAPAPGLVAQARDPTHS